MAKDTHDREDLLREATGYAERLELRVDGVDPVVFCGFRADGGLSICWGQDDVVQFNSSCELRRAFAEQRILASYQHRLHWLNRNATARVKLSRQLVPEESATTWLALWERRLQLLLNAMTDRKYEVLGQAPPHGEVDRSFSVWLANRPASIQLAAHPGAG